MRYWLMKCEPNAYSIEMLECDKTASWEGVRNYQARNFMKEMAIGDLAFFYHSNANPSGIAGLMRVIKTAYPDPFETQEGHKYFDPKATLKKPIWVSVNVAFVSKAKKIISIQTLRQIPELSELMILKPGSRLSITPVSASEFQAISGLI